MRSRTPVSVAGDLTVYNANAAPSGRCRGYLPDVPPAGRGRFPDHVRDGCQRRRDGLQHSRVKRPQRHGFTLNLTKAVYCSIFNGDILNWNNVAIKNLNSAAKTSLQDLVSDTAARWTTDGAPIRLVGRLDKSGTTDVFTRHLAAVCNATYGYTGTNKYQNNAESLPYSASGSGNADFRTVRADSNYFPGVASSKLAGTTNLISGDYWTGSAIANIGAGTPTSLPTGNVGSGLYLIADGGGRVATALAATPDYVLNGVRLSGKVGYISADFVQPSVDAPGGLQAAALQVANTTAYALPTVRAATYGITPILPPETASTGLYQAGDVRQVNLPAGGKGNATRANPLAWTDVLYADPANTLADPQAALSYPISGTTQFFGYTCYKTNTRLALVNSLGLQFSKIRKDSVNAALPVNLFNSTVPTAPGIDVQSNIGLMPLPWLTAITNTFLYKAPTDAGASALNLSIQDLLMAKLATATKPQVDPQPNSSCASLPGA